MGYLDYHKDRILNLTESIGELNRKRDIEIRILTFVVNTIEVMLVLVRSNGGFIVDVHHTCDYDELECDDIDYYLDLEIDGPIYIILDEVQKVYPRAFIIGNSISIPFKR